MSLAVKNGKPTTAGWAAILCVFMIMGSLSIFTPALRVIGGQFPDVPQATVTLISTLPGLCLIPTSLICSFLIDRGLKFRPFVIVGAILYIITGLMPMIDITNFTLILVSRVCFGLALGISMPLANAAVLRWYHGEECAKKCGQGAGFMLLMTVFYQIFSGYIAAVGWQYVCLIHLVGFFPLIAAFIAWPEPEKVILDAKKAAAEEASAEEAAELPDVEQDEGPKKFNPRIIFSYLCFWINCALVSVVLLNSAYFIAAKGLGESVLAGYFGAIITLTGFVIGMVFGRLFKVLGRYMIGAGMIVAALGMFVIFAAGDIITLIIGAILVGAGFCIPQPGLTFELGIFIPQRMVSISSGFQQVFKALSNFLAGYFVVLIGFIIPGANQETLLISAAVCGIVVGVIFCVVRIFRPLPNESKLKQ